MPNSLVIYQVLQYNTALAICLASLAYDIALHLPDEIEYIWIGMDWYSVPKYLYLISRYQGFLFPFIALGPNPNATDQVSFSIVFTRCRSIEGWYTECGVPLMTAMVSAILMLRVSALYGHSKFVVAGFGLMTFILIKAIPYLFTVPLAGCAILLPPSISPQRRAVAIFWGPCLFNSLILFIMTLAACCKLYFAENPRVLHRQWKQVKLYPLLSLILTDGTIFFFLIFIADLIMTIQDCSDTPLTTSSEQLLPWIIAIRSVAGSRLILNIRRMMYKSTVYSRRHFTSIFFAQVAARLDNIPSTN
ncbi:hypothetical protein BDQ17DRAFT_1366391 [Cyathus striatus]|nr:hypothetical protein BDQ17DRAFT_1366391 [Cyathus striatus]